MKRWEHLAEATLPDGSGTMTLHRRDTELVIRVNGHDLMSTRMHGSEDALGEVGCEACGAKPGARVLIGGLGMGFTLAAALKALREDAEVVVAELVPEVVEWNRGELGEAAGRPLEDARVEVFEGDVMEPIRSGVWDAILLDVDNGPDGLTTSSNDDLYGVAGLTAIHRALKPKGVLGVWSVANDEDFTRRLKKVGFKVRTEMVRASGGKGRKHIVWFGAK